MLLEFVTMNEEEIYRMVHEVYPEGSYENARDKFPEQEDLTEAIREEELYFMGFLRKFFSKEENRYYVLEIDGAWVSALRLTRLDGFYYLEALETAEQFRKKGYAAKLFLEVIELLKERGNVVLRSNVSKKNEASLATHNKCGFVIEHENGINYITGVQRENVYGMIYRESVNEGK